MDCTVTLLAGTTAVVKAAAEVIVEPATELPAALEADEELEAPPLMELPVAATEEPDELEPALAAAEELVGAGELEAGEEEPADVVGAEAPLLQLMKLGVTVAVPEYRGQPGVSVFGGAIPPPQSGIEQTSQVPGT